MKKILLIVAAVSSGFLGYAQNKNVTSAKLALDSDHDPVKAKEFIEKAIDNPSTKDEAKTWFVRSEVYLALQNDPQQKASAPYREAAKSLKKVMELKADYEQKAVTRNLLVCAYLYYNDGISAYNSRKLDEASDLMKEVTSIHDMDGGKKYASNKGFDTVAANALFVEANSAFYSHKYQEAIPLLNQVKGNPIINKPSVYAQLADAYTQTGQKDKSLAIIQEGRKLFPDDVTLRNAELNYYIKSGEQDAMIKKLQDAVDKDPNNAELQFALATGYNNAAFPTKGDKPANFADYISKAEAAYKKAISIDQDNAIYNYNLGALYYNQASDLIDQMNKLGNSDAEMKKYDELKKQRDDMFSDALPYLEKAFNTLDAKASSITGEDRNTYHSCMIALREIYARQSKMDKAAAMKKKIESFH